VTSCSLWAARPVGAASATFFPEASQAPTTAAVVAVFPVPGPPVKSRTEDGEEEDFCFSFLPLPLLLLVPATAAATAARCCSESLAASGEEESQEATSKAGGSGGEEDEEEVEEIKEDASRDSSLAAEASASASSGAATLAPGGGHEDEAEAECCWRTGAEGGTGTGGAGAETTAGSVHAAAPRAPLSLQLATTFLAVAGPTPCTPVSTLSATPESNTPRSARPK